MEKIETKLPGTFILEPRQAADVRGHFIKTFHRETFLSLGLEAEIAESFYTVSKKDVIRGMHFQVPPADLAKIVFVTRGAVRDVVLDIRRGSPTYGQWIVEELSASNARMLYIPKGYAHGFLSLEDDTTMTYFQTSPYSALHDMGIHPLSFGLEWDIPEPIMSARDEALPPLSQFDSPFIYENPR